MRDGRPLGAPNRWITLRALPCWTGSLASRRRTRPTDLHLVTRIVSSATNTFRGGCGTGAVFLLNPDSRFLRRHQVLPWPKPIWSSRPPGPWRCAHRVQAIAGHSCDVLGLPALDSIGYIVEAGRFARLASPDRIPSGRPPRGVVGRRRPTDGKRSTQRESPGADFFTKRALPKRPGRSDWKLFREWAAGRAIRAISQRPSRVRAHLRRIQLVSRGVHATRSRRGTPSPAWNKVKCPARCLG